MKYASNDFSHKKNFFDDKFYFFEFNDEILFKFKYANRNSHIKKLSTKKNDTPFVP